MVLDLADAERTGVYVPLIGRNRRQLRSSVPCQCRTNEASANRRQAPLLPAGSQPLGTRKNNANNNGNDINNSVQLSNPLHV